MQYLTSLNLLRKKCSNLCFIGSKELCSKTKFFNFKNVWGPKELSLKKKLQLNLKMQKWQISSQMFTWKYHLFQTSLDIQHVPAKQSNHWTLLRYLWQRFKTVHVQTFRIPYTWSIGKRYHFDFIWQYLAKIYYS